MQKTRNLALFSRRTQRRRKKTPMGVGFKATGLPRRRGSLQREAVIVFTALVFTTVAFSWPAIACDKAKLALAVAGEHGYRSRPSQVGEYCEGFVRREVSSDGLFSLQLSSVMMAAEFPPIRPGADEPSQSQWSVSWPRLEGVESVRIAARHTSSDVFYSLDHPSYSVDHRDAAELGDRFKWSTEVMAAAPFTALDWTRLRVDVSTVSDGRQLHLPVILNRPPAPAGGWAPWVYVQLLPSDAASVVSASVAPLGDEEHRRELAPTDVPADLQRGRVANLRLAFNKTTDGVVELHLKYRLAGREDVETAKFWIVLPPKTFRERWQ